MYSVSRSFSRLLPLTEDVCFPMFLPCIFVRRYEDCDGEEQGRRQVRHTVWHHPNAYYHVNGEPGDDNRESISAIQIAGLRRYPAKMRRIEENKG